MLCEFVKTLKMLKLIRYNSNLGINFHEVSTLKYKSGFVSGFVKAMKLPTLQFPI
jgi:hypothetical protein